jgi:caa(3)-type oxidase subunit IV
MTERHETFPSLPRLLGTGAALLLLAALSYASSFLHWGTLGLALALGFAVLKAGLVLRVFMELLGARASVQLAALAAALMLLLLVIFTAADVGTREEPPLLPHVAQQRR